MNRQAEAMLTGLITELVANYPPSVRPLSALVPLGNAGGLSGASLWRYQAPAGELVVRAWPEQGPSLAHLSRLHDWIREAADPSLPIPVPFRTLAGPSLCERGGRFWEITPWMSGTPDLDQPPAPGHMRSAFETLATLHRRLDAHQRSEPSPGLRSRVTELHALLGAGFAELERAIRAEPDDPLCAQGRRWLALAREVLPNVFPVIEAAATVSVPVQPCLRDARPEHFLFEGDRLTGLIDLGAMGLDSVAADLARLVGEWLPGDPGRRVEALAAYRRVRPLEEAEHALLPHFERVADILIAGHWLQWHFLEHRAFADPDAAAKGTARGLARLERLAECTIPRQIII